MTKMLKVVIISLLLLAGVAGADPFSSLWNWNNEKVHGKVKEIITQNKHAKLVETYNKKGQKTKVVEYQDQHKSIVILKYNKDGDLYKLSVRDDGAVEPKLVETAEYKSKGIIKSLTQAYKGKVDISGEFEYDKKKRLKSIKKKRPKSIKIKDDLGMNVWTYEFDEKGNLIVGSVTESDFLFRFKYMKFQKGNPTVMEYYFGEILVMTTTYEYKYDKADNWIEKKIINKIHHDKPGEKVRDPKIIKRTITYYPEKKKLN